MSRAYEKLAKKLRNKVRSRYKVNRRKVLPDLVKKQDGLCYLCGEKMRTSGPGNHPRYATIEHVRPISEFRSYANKDIRAACRACNTAKGSMSLKEFHAAQKHQNASTKN